MAAMRTDLVCALRLGYDREGFDSELRLSALPTAYRVETRFKQTLQAMQADSLRVRQLAENAFIVTAPHPGAGVEYILSTFRRPDEPRTFTNLGRCVQFAVEMSGLKTIHFELLAEPAVTVNGD